MTKADPHDLDIWVLLIDHPCKFLNLSDPFQIFITRESSTRVENGFAPAQILPTGQFTLVDVIEGPSVLGSVENALINGFIHQPHMLTVVTVEHDIVDRPCVFFRSSH